MGLTLSSEPIAKAQRFNQALTRLKNVSGGIGRTIVEKLLPTFAEIIVRMLFHRTYPQSRFVINDLRNRHRKTTVRFVLREDLTSPINRAVISWLLPTDTQRVLTAPTDSKGYSAIRTYFKEHPNFFALIKEEMEKVDQDTLPLLPAVKNYIWEQGLYGPQSSTTFWVCPGYWLFHR